MDLYHSTSHLKHTSELKLMMADCVLWETDERNYDLQSMSNEIKAFGTCITILTHRRAMSDTKLRDAILKCN